jgi:hypothetical protein
MGVLNSFAEVTESDQGGQVQVLCENINSWAIDI